MKRQAKPLRRARRRVRAFTLIETTVALFVMAVGILPIISLVLAARHLDQQAQLRTVAYQLAWQELEALRSLPLADRTVTTQTAFAIPASLAQTDPGLAFTGAYSISTVTGVGDSKHGVQQITVSVSWQNTTAAAAPSNVRVTAIVAQGAGT